jgi:hypothetical protein
MFAKIKETGEVVEGILCEGKYFDKKINRAAWRRYPIDQVEILDQDEKNNEKSSE